MSLDAFGLTGTPTRGLPVEAYHGPWPLLDSHGNVHWWRCVEPRCSFRTDPEAQGGKLWAIQRAEHATAHPDRDPATLGHPDSLGGCHLAAPPGSYLRDDGRVQPYPD